MDHISSNIMTSAADPTGSGANRDFQVVKCVVVGDTGVGKTRLICSRACGNEYSLPQLMTTHVPTVWAIDHYRKDREILNRSWCTVDGLNISLRLWDTFGYHDKDRRFAYGRADVILVCFSAVRPRSLRSVYHHWFPEIQRLCPETPIILCATQIDLRYLYQDPDFINLDKGPFFREIREDDILPPDRGRSVAKEISAHYYESSVLLGFGINDLFTNVIRAALIHKRDKHFWNQLGGLKRITKPMCQPPHQPTKPACPEIVIPQPTLNQDLLNLLETQSYSDVVFVVQGVTMPAHKACLIVASPVFEELFQKIAPSVQDNLDIDDAALLTSAGNRNCTGVSNYDHLRPSVPIDNMADSPRHLSLDTARLLDNEELKPMAEPDMVSGAVTNGNCSTSLPPSSPLILPAFCTSIEHKPMMTQVDSSSNHQIVVTLHNNISVRAFSLVLHYLYNEETANHLDQDVEMPVLHQLKQTADLMGLQDLAFLVANILNKEGFMNKAILASVSFQRCQRRKDLLVKRGLQADVVFQVEDGNVRAHKALLMASCDVMAGMFSFNFRESSAKLIPFPGVLKDAFVALQDYLYSGQCPPLSTIDCLDLIELANRLCLPRLVALTEQYIINELTAAEDAGKDIVDDVVLFIEPAQLHNAGQLAAWCLWYVSSRYTQIYHSHAKLLQTLRPDNQVYLNKHRWPPLWYLKEVDYYEKCVVDLERQRQKPMRSYIRRGSDDINSGCLGFCGRRNRRLKCEPSPTAAVMT